MRFDRFQLHTKFIFASLILLLAGCVSTGGESSSRLTPANKSDQAESAARVHTDLGQQYMQNGDLQSALEKLTKALQFDPNYVPAHTVVAVLYERINDMPNAELHYRKAVTLDPSKGAANNNLGAFLCKTGRNAEAVAYFQKAVADPFYQTPAVAWSNAGNCLMRSNDYAGAEADFRKAIDVDPQNADALYQIANLLYQRGDAFRARAFVQRFDALGQPSPAALKLGHDVESRLGNRDAALTYSKRLQSQFPDSEQAHALDATASP
ncbi:type IV pilus biogenesis/stability protein PilW [Dyella tabacisoli]|uniref:Type IV pilus biogenesis/stability protein PilW n=1 Tax=Dyella tabacisoli TaxID=2282381 RepID=A0A369UKI7_9GAMM|nr:type IV pilus biogenesis/stability protein PilW [Dyella tabacisoli]RDD81274.1 type IV pilus biogenesis/stability protein PilW [Dyella tabacisoli]